MQQHEMTIDRHAVIVDDEPLFLKFAAIPFQSGICEFCTWHLHTFTDTDAALAFIGHDPNGVDVLLTDYNMPQMDGLELIESARRLPRSSGTLPSVLVSSDLPSLMPPSIERLSKPYTKDDVRAALCNASIVCATGTCTKHDGTAKPQPPAEAQRPRITSDPPGIFSR